MLCNACGSRWRTKGTLANYAPLHSRVFVPVDSDECENSEEYKLASKKKQKNLSTGAQNEYDIEVGEIISRYKQSTKDFEDDVSDKSSSGSGLSFTESCSQLGATNGNDISGLSQSYFWDSHIPSRKRTGKKRQCPSPIEKLRRELYDILQEQESSCLSGSSEEVLIFEKEGDPTVSDEIGLGSVLIKQPLSSSEEEPEINSLGVENKILCSNDAYTEPMSFPAELQSFKFSCIGDGKCKVIPEVGQEETIENPTKGHAFLNISVENSPISNLHMSSANHPLRLV